MATAVGRRIKCLDKGFTELIDWMPSSDNPRDVESAIVECARVSTTTDRSKQIKSESQDKALIRYLFRNKHTSPFEAVKFKFCIKCPIFVARQVMRHRCSNINEFSGRYSEFSDEYYDPLNITDSECPGGGIRFQDNSLTGNKQGSTSGEVTEEIKDTFKEINSHINAIFTLYHSIIEKGVSKEVARYGLPVATYTQFYFTMDLHNLLHFLSLRMNLHAQPEIRVFANAMFDLIKDLVPTVIECFETFTLNSVSFSSDELRAIQKKDLSEIKGQRERSELVDKLESFGSSFYSLPETKEERIRRLWDRIPGTAIKTKDEG